MKTIFTTTLALAASVFAVEVEILAEAETEADADQNNIPLLNPAIVPEYYAAAVHEYDLTQPTTDADTYAKQVDIFSD
jgi:hypothetical protein